jgi:hypothetical protein
MTVQTTLFTQIFTLWPDASVLAGDMGVPRNRARQWINRSYLPPWYWPRLVDVVEQRFSRIVTYRQLVEAAAAQRGQALIAGQAKGAETRRHKREFEAELLEDGRSEAA